MNTLKLKAIADLIRLDKQYGTLLLMMPTLWGLFLAADGRPSLKHLFVFVSGSFIMRSAGCVINDMADRNFDRYVERTRERPLASGRLTLKEAWMVLAVLLLVALLLVSMLNYLAFILSFVAIFLASIYPFMKRYIHVPQFFLGMAFGWGIIMAWAAVRNHLDLTPFLLFIANIFWAIGYDTIYALMDIEDDKRIGVKSTAILFGKYVTHALLIIFFLTILFLFMAGIRAHLGSIYFFSLLLSLTGFIYQVIQIKKGLSRDGLFYLFRSHVWIGLIVLLGIIGDIWRG